MKEFPKVLNSLNCDNFHKLQVHRWTCYARDEIYEFMIKQDSQSLLRDYFDFTGFFAKFGIKEEVDKMAIMDTIILELKDKNWHLAKVFGGLGLVICNSQEMLGKSVWNSSLDFTKL